MRNILQKCVQYLIEAARLLPLRLTVLLAIGMTAALLSACGTQQSLTIIKHVVIAPADDLLANCVVAPPPAKIDYLKDYTVGINAMGLSIQAESSSIMLAYLQGMLKNAEERERQLTALNLQHYQNLDKCNRRLQQLRNWKAQAISQIQALDGKE